MLEIKCPHSTRDFATLKEASSKHQIGLKYDRDGNTLAAKNPQVLLPSSSPNVCHRAKILRLCSLVCIRILRDEIFIQEKLTKVLKFYKDYILPELIDSRKERGMKLKRRHRKQGKQ